MNLRQIEVFHAVYLAGSISGASRRLNVSQPSVSKVIKHAETALGFKLFTLAKGRLKPTDEAHLLFRDVADLHSRIDVFNQSARNLRSMVGGHLRIGVLPSLALTFTPQVIAGFRKLHPDATFDVSALHHDSFIHMLEARECEFVIGHQLIFNADLASIVLGKGRVGALFKPGAIEGHGSRIAIENLRGREIIGLSPGVAIGASLPADIFSGGADHQPTLVARSVYIAAALARHSGIIAIVDEFTARGYVDDDLIFRPLEPDISFDLVALHLADRPLSRLAGRFLDFKRSMIIETQHWMEDEEAGSQL